jgi:hypothetical protein
LPVLRFDGIKRKSTTNRFLPSGRKKRDPSSREQEKPEAGRVLLHEKGTACRLVGFALILKRLSGEIRNPNIEIRNKCKIRNTNAQNSTGIGFELSFLVI